MSDLVIETEGLTKRYGSVLAVDSLSLQVERGAASGADAASGCTRRFARAVRMTGS